MKKILLILVVVVASVAVGYSATTVFFKTNSEVASLVENKILTAQAGRAVSQGSYYGTKVCCHEEQERVYELEEQIGKLNNSQNSKQSLPTRIQSTESSVGSRAKDVTSPQPNRSRVQRFFDSIMLKIRSSLPSKVASTEDVNGSTQVAQPSSKWLKLQGELADARKSLRECIEKNKEKIENEECILETRPVPFPKSR